MNNQNSPFQGQKPIELASQGIESLKAVYNAVSSIACSDEGDQE
ncbi:hypothetical protein RS130_19515 [Paraglaciecola aquimarina]|uniref:Antitoxin Xre/MbcA/ParS-like toxin-binding domain-containing protein n=1 Tax=Paraglaciecola aquimarina TaxID=1235557 RepID=A0ABU3T0J6_9ALTE|nr:hypothetical protein [Paraglaciecola aquimarina]MDU0355781.1 hypothetical protein [Paraglaciecola aquimarina]